MNENLLPPFGCIAIGLGFLIFGIFLRRKLQASKSWPKTDGTVVESNIQSGWEGSGGRRMYVVKPKVVYEYSVAGTSYSSSQLALVEVNSANEERARRIAGKYSAGQKVDVYYNPRKTSFAILEVGDPTQGKLPIGMTIFGFVLAAAGFVWLLKH